MRSNFWKGLVLSLLLTLALVTPVTALPPEQVAAWEEDLDFLAREAPAKHPDFFHSLSRESWHTELDALSRALPELPPHHVVVEVARIVAAVGDGHTRLTLPLAPGVDFFRGHSETPPPNDPVLRLRQLPIRLELLDDGLFVTAIEPRHRRLHGARVLRIGRLSAEDAMAAVAPTIQRDNEMGVRLRLPERMVLAEVLHARGVTDSPDRAAFVVQDEDGSPLTVALEAVRRPAIERLVLDLRGNPGGDNSLNQPLVHAMIRAEKLREPGRLFVLIDRGTFSAALMLTVDLERHTPALFVGEPTGGKPNHFGDSRKLELPRSGLTVRISSLEWQYSSPRDDRSWVPPHLPVAVTSEHFFAGRDPVLDAVLDGFGPAGGLEPGTGQGSLSFGSLRLDASLELERDADGWNARVDIPAQGVEGRELDAVRVDGARLTFDLPLSAGDALPFAGRIARGWIVGTLLQEAREIRVFLRGSTRGTSTTAATFTTN